MKVRCKQADGTVFLTLGRVYPIVNANYAHNSCYTVYDDSGGINQYNKSRFDIVDEGARKASQKPDWDALADTVDGFLGWADPEPTKPLEARYAVAKTGTHNFCRWVRVSPTPGEARIRSSKCFGGARSTFQAQVDALENKKTMLKRYR